MGADGDAPADVGHDEVQFVPWLPEVLRGPAHRGLDVEGVAQGDLRQFRQAGDLCHGVHFVHRHGVHNEGGNVPGTADGVGEYASEVGGVLPGLAHAETLQQHVVHGVGSPGDGLHEPAPPRHGGKFVEGCPVGGQSLRYGLQAEGKLVGHRGKGGEGVRIVPDRLTPGLSAVGIPRDLCACGTGIDCKDLKGHGSFLPCVQRILSIVF